ncbi:hypothetical protein J6590_056920 [Homalodisca vitripennis]|nr:hypothetical protein J6590_056920 [Homalodisca vitripennis]
MSDTTDTIDVALIDYQLRLEDINGFWGRSRTNRSTPSAKLIINQGNINCYWLQNSGSEKTQGSKTKNAFAQGAARQHEPYWLQNNGNEKHEGSKTKRVCPRRCSLSFIFPKISVTIGVLYCNSRVATKIVLHLKPICKRCFRLNSLFSETLVLLRTLTETQIVTVKF